MWSDTAARKHDMNSLERQRSADNASAVQKYPIRRFEVSIKKFVKILTIDLDRLDRHRQNTERLTTQENWTLLNKEQVNASRTVQQIKANLREIEKARAQIIKEDLSKFDACIAEVKLKSVQAVRDFLSVGQTGGTSPLGELAITPISETPSRTSFTQPDDSTSQAVLIPRQLESPSESVSHSLPSSSDFTQIQLLTDTHTTTVNPETVASWEHLQEDLVDLNCMISQFSSLVQDQGEKVDNIEDKIESAQINTQQATANLSFASKYKAALFPVAGAVLGGILGGPFGFVAGVKIGSVAAVSGGVAGFIGGRAIKKHQEKATDLEMKNLSIHRGNSLENIPKSVEKFS